MADKKGPAKGATKGRKNRKSVKMNTLFDNAGKSKRKTCPKCGAGVYMGEHKGRTACGKCGYTEFKK